MLSLAFGFVFLTDFVLGLFVSTFLNFTGVNFVDQHSEFSEFGSTFNIKPQILNSCMKLMQI